MYSTHYDAPWELKCMKYVAVLLLCLSLPDWAIAAGARYFVKQPDDFATGWNISMALRNIIPYPLK